MSVIASAFSGGANPLTIGGLGTTQKIFQSSLVGQTNFSLQPGMPGGLRLSGHTFYVRMGGNTYLHGTTPTIQLQLLGFVPGGSNVILAQSAAVTLTTNAAYDWSLTAKFVGSQAAKVLGQSGGAGILTGTFNTLINGTLGADATLTNNLAAVDFTLEPPFTFLAAALFTPTDALQLATLTEFYAWVDRD